MLTFGLIGLGYFGKHYLRLLVQQGGVRLAAIADPSPVAFQAHRENIPSKTICINSAEELLRLPEINCVIIASPAQSHFKLACAALKFGKHVLLEKPMVMNLKEAYALKKEVERSKKIFLLGHQYLYNDYVRHLKQKLEKRMLGEVRYVFSENLQYGPIRKNIGCFWETAAHEVSILDYLFGPFTISDITGCASSVLARSNDDFSATEITLNGKIVVAIVISWFMPQKTRRITIVGKRGMAVFDDCKTRDKLKFFDSSYPEDVNGSSHFFEMNNQQVSVARINAKEPLRNELTHFIGCVLSNKKPLTDINHGVRVTKLLTQISRTYQ